MSGEQSSDSAAQDAHCASFCATPSGSDRNLANLKHDPEKCEAVFRKDHSIKGLKRDSDSTQSHRALDLSNRAEVPDYVRWIFSDPDRVLNQPVRRNGKIVRRGHS